MSYSELLTGIHRRLARSILFVRLLLKIRNQCQCVLRFFFNEGCLPNYNGEHRVMKAFAPACSHFIDVGANIGAWTGSFLGFAPSGVRGLLVEPGRVAGGELRKRFGGDDRCEILDAALSDREGEANYYEEPSAGETSSMVLGFSRSGAECRRVQLSTLDRQVQRLGWERVTFLKVDAEGYDLHVLRGAEGLLAAGRIDVIQFEYNLPWKLAGSRLAEAVRLLEAHGYRLYLVKAAGLVHLRCAEWIDYFDYSNYLAVRAGVTLPAALPVHDLRIHFW